MMGLSKEFGHECSASHVHGGSLRVVAGDRIFGFCTKTLQLRLISGRLSPCPPCEGPGDRPGSQRDERGPHRPHHPLDSHATLSAYYWRYSHVSICLMLQFTASLSFATLGSISFPWI